MKSFKLVFVFFSVTIYACTNVLCGDLSDEWMALKLNAQQTFSNQFEIENIPCDFYYVNVKAKGDRVDSSSLKSLHDKLYDSLNKIGWPTFIVHDKNGKYLFHDPISGPRYKKS